MWTLNRRASAFVATLTALALLTPALPDALALWHSDPGHAHDHGSAHAGGWTLLPDDHPPQDAAHLDPATFVRHSPCAVCAGRARTIVPLLPLAPEAARQDTRGAITGASRPSVASPIRLSGGPRAPPAV